MNRVTMMAMREKEKHLLSFPLVSLQAFKQTNDSIK
jgi:hypothetical protein